MTQAEKKHIVEQIAAGRSVTDIVDDPEIIVGYRTVNRELNRDPFFLSEYARAREARIEPIVEEIEAVILGKGEWEKVDFEMRKEIVNQRRWEAIRLQRFRYGDKIDVNATVKHVEGRVIDAEALDYEQLLAIKEALQITEGVANEEEEYDDND